MFAELSVGDAEQQASLERTSEAGLKLGKGTETSFRIYKLKYKHQCDLNRAYARHADP